MKTIFVAIVMAMLPLAAFASNDLSQSGTHTAIPDTTPQFIVGDREYPGERVVDLPNDSCNWYTSVFVHSTPTPRDAFIVNYFNSGELSKLQRQTHFQVMRQSSPTWARYINLTQQLPSVVLQDNYGRVVFKASGSNCLLDTQAILTRSISAAIRRHPRSYNESYYWNCPCPRPEPTPQPQPQPQPGPPNIIPDDTDAIPDETPGTDQFEVVLISLGIFAVVLVGALVAGFARRAEGG